MPEKRNNKPFKKDYPKKRREDGDDNKRFTPKYNASDKDELAPPRFLPRDPGESRRPSSGPPKRGFNDRPSKPYNDNGGDRPKRPYTKRDDSKPFGDKPKRTYGADNDRKPYGDRPKAPYGKRDDRKPFGDGPKTPYGKRDDRKPYGDGPKTPYGKRDDRKPYGDAPKRTYTKRDDNKPFGDKPRGDYKKRDGGTDKPQWDKPRTAGPVSRDKRSRPESDGTKKPFRPSYDPEVKTKRSYNDAPLHPPKKTFTERKKALTGETEEKDAIRLNKYVANSGICSRREADELIAKGQVAVNGKVIKEMGYKVNKTDTVTFDGKKILPEPYVYVLMNKPKDFLTTTEDDRGRKTVMDLVADKIPQRIFPVGRLDRNTTGVLLLTNDGEVTQALTHPSFEIKKVYQAELDKKATSADLDKLVGGIQLEDGEAHADSVAFVDADDKRQIGIEIHSGRNRIVRRMFEHLGYEVEKLDRVSFGIFTKKDLPRGKWRFLTQSEVSFLMKLKKDM